MNKIKPFKLYSFHTFYINVEGVGQWVFEKPNENGDKIFDRIIDSSTTHNLKSITRIDNNIFFNFVTQDDEEGRMLDVDDVDVLYKWLIYTPSSDQDFIDDYLGILGSV